MAKATSDDGTTDPTEDALRREDPRALSERATLDQIDRLKAAEQLFELRYQRKKRSSRVAIASQSLISFVAIAGFLVNAYQSYLNKQQQQQQRAVDQERWSREFARASQADKYRAFFETSVLATDPANADKRLVGYALLQEFVQDRDYTQKAMIMLEESLSQELSSNTEPGLDSAHRAAVTAILGALSGTTDCRALERAARSVDRIARRHARFRDREETSEVLRVYVNRIMGRAADVCTAFKDFRAVRKPIRDTALRIPELLALPPGAGPKEANTRLAEALRDGCLEDLNVSGTSDCADALRGYAELCGKADPKELQEDGAACDVMKTAASQLKAPPASQPQATPHP
ncbi:MAG TPA: hypothetical protein VF341_02465 [Anaeromyxobacteraceae bacterium]